MKYIVVLLFTNLLFSVSPVFAEDHERSVTGAVVRVKQDSRIMTLRDSMTRKQVDIYLPTTAVITLDGQPARLRDYQRGYLATITYIRRDDGTNEAVVARVPDPEIIVEVPPVEEMAEAEPVVAELPKTASNDYLYLLLGLALVAVGLVTWRGSRARV